LKNLKKIRPAVIAVTAVTAVVVLALMAASVIFTGCAATENELLYYQQSPANVRLLLKNEDDVYLLDVTLGDLSGKDILSAAEFGRESASITVISPESIAGIVYAFEPNGVYLISGDVKIPLNPTDVRGLYPLLRCFNVSEIDLVNVASEDSVTTAEFKIRDGVLTVWLSENGLPEKLELIGPAAFTVEIVSYSFGNSPTAAEALGINVKKR